MPPEGPVPVALNPIWTLAGLPHLPCALTARDLLDENQFGCEADQPFCFAVEVGDSWVKFELLIRSRVNFRSPHVSYASRTQRQFILEFVTSMIDELGIKT